MPKKNYDYMIGKRFGRLVVKEIFIENGHSKAKCICDCGSEKAILLFSLIKGETKSCGCLFRGKMQEICKEKLKKGENKTRLYEIWHSMIQRCYYPNNEAFKWYGEKGVIVCDSWKENYETFKNWANENGYDENAPYGKCTIDRINPYGNYEPSNCRWVDMKTQANNKRNKHINKTLKEVIGENENE